MTVLGKVPQPYHMRSNANGRWWFNFPKHHFGQYSKGSRSAWSRWRAVLADGRPAERDALLIMLSDGMASACPNSSQHWDQVDLRAGTLHVARLNHGPLSTHPPRGPKPRALRAWRREQDDTTLYVFTSLRGGSMTRRAVHHV